MPDPALVTNQILKWHSINETIIYTAERIFLRRKKETQRTDYMYHSSNIPRKFLPQSLAQEPHAHFVLMNLLCARLISSSFSFLHFLVFRGGVHPGDMKWQKLHLHYFSCNILSDAQCILKH